MRHWTTTAWLLALSGVATLSVAAWDATAQPSSSSDTPQQLALAQDQPDARPAQPRPRDRQRDTEREGDAQRRRTGESATPGTPEGPGSGQAGPDFRRRRTPELTAEQIEERLEILREVYPELAQRMEKLREENTERVSRALMEEAFWLGRFVEMKRTDQEMYELMVENMRLERTTRDLSRDYRRALEAGRKAQADKIRQELAARLQEHFDVRQRMRERELHAIEQRLAQMRQSLEERRNSRDQLIQQRLDQLTGERRDRVEW